MNSSSLFRTLKTMFIFLQMHVTGKKRMQWFWKKSSGPLAPKVYITLWETVEETLVK